MDGALEEPISSSLTPEAVGGRPACPTRRHRRRDQVALPFATARVCRAKVRDGNITVAPGITIPRPAAVHNSAWAPQPNRPQQRGRPGPRWGF